jgi:hypothetical protein
MAFLAHMLHLSANQMKSTLGNEKIKDDESIVEFLSLVFDT